MYKNQYMNYRKAVEDYEAGAFGKTADIVQTDLNNKSQKLALEIIESMSRVKKENEELKNNFKKEDVMVEVPVETTSKKTKVYSDVDSFIRKLAQSESSGDYSAENKEGYVGLLQIGKARLKDFNKANKTNFTMDKFKNSKSMQDRVNRWHLADIDRVYDEKNISIDRDSFRAIAHLGGISGALKYVETGGEYDPADSNNTKLSDYDKKFRSTV